MPQFFSLQEAANILKLPVEELSELARKREIRAFADAGTWKFREKDLDDFSRDRAERNLPETDMPMLAFDEKTRLPDPGSELPDLEAGTGDEDLPFIGLGDEGEDDFSTVFEDGPAEVKAQGKSKPPADEIEDILGDDDTTKPPSDSDVRLVADVDLEEATLAKPPSDSDIRLVADADLGLDDSVDLSADTMKAPSDSDIRLTFEGAGVRPGKGKGKPDLGATAEIDLDGGLPDLDDSAEVDLGKTEAPSEADSESGDLDFRFDDDLNTGFKVDDTDFELDLTDFASGELDSDEAPPPKGKPAAKAPTPTPFEQTTALGDISKTIKKSAGVPESDDDALELAPSDDEIALAPDDSGVRLDKSEDSGSDSEFELTLEDSDSESGSDIFETDDFDVPSFKDDDEDDEKPKAKPAKSAALAAEESGSEDTEEVTEESDFELAIDDEIEAEEESGSEVVALDEDEEEASDEGDEEADEEFDEYGDEVPATAGAVSMPRRGGVAVAESAPWPGWMLAFLIPTTMLLPFVGIMMYEVMRNAWSYQTPYSMNGTIINKVTDLAKMIGL